MFNSILPRVTNVSSVWSRFGCVSAQYDPWSALGLFCLAQVLRLFGLARGWSRVCSIWPKVGLMSVRSGRVLVSALSGPGWAWVCSVWPFSLVFSVRPSVDLDMFGLAPILGLFGPPKGWS